MEPPATSSALPQLDENDLAAIEALLMRQIRAQDLRGKAFEQLKAVNASIAEYSKITDGIYAALTAIYGFVEPEEEGQNKWAAVRDALGIERYNRAIAAARGESPPLLLARMGEGGAASAEKITRSGIPIRTAVLEYLRGVEKGATARQVRQHLLNALGIETHEKTPGMTLYRLMKDGLVRREGRTWYAKPAEEDDSDTDTRTGADLA